MLHNPSLLDKDAVTTSNLDFLGQISVRYPIRNKAKSINTNIVNYQFEGNQNIKQEMVMMEFDFFDQI
jgi:hypothetical protein